MEKALPLIIRRPALQTFAQQKTGYGILLFGWAFLLVLLHPLIVSIGWVISGFLFQKALLIETTRIWDNFYANFVAFYGVIILLIWVTFFLWFFYNYKRYGGAHDHRTVTRSSAVTAEEYAQRTGFSAKDISALQNAKLVIFHFDQAGEFKELYYLNRNMETYLSANKEGRNQQLVPVFLQSSLALKLKNLHAICTAQAIEHAP